MALTASSSFALTPLVELPYEPVAGFWWPLPLEPRWPAHVALSAQSSDEDVARVLQQLAQYNADAAGTLLSPAQLVASGKRLILPGGLRASAGPHEVMPSCCCGLENWVEWERLLADGPSPWMGHDPSPWVESTADGYAAWPDGGLEGLQRSGDPVRFGRAELVAQLREVRRTLDAFVARIAVVVGARGLPADALAHAFARAFLSFPAHDAIAS